jgi:hypothetical protein
MRIAQMIWFEGDRRYETSIVSQNLLHAYRDAQSYPKSILVLEDRGIRFHLDVHENKFDVLFLPTQHR